MSGAIFLKNKLPVFILVLFAFALQMQISLFSSEDYIGLRVNLADLFMPLIGIFVICSLFFKQSDWPQFHIKHLYYWLAGLGSIFFLALLNSYIHYEVWSQWALINKCMGWLVLSAYFLLGGWLAFNASARSLLLFFKLAVFFFVAVLVCESTLALFRFYDLRSWLPVLELPMEGFMANKNSLIFLGLSLLGATTCLTNKVFSKAFCSFFWFLILVIFIFTGTRAGIIALFFLFFLLFFLPLVPWKNIFKGLVAGILFISIVQITSSQSIFFFYQKAIPSKTVIENVSDGQPPEFIEKEGEYVGDSHRLKILDTTKNMIIENPIFGSGLGSAKIEQEKQWGEFYTIIDCTPLWLWAETGLIGLLLFCTFYFLCLRRLWVQSRHQGNNEVYRAINQSVLVMLIIFSVMCLFHELLYTRFLWFFLGLSMALPEKAFSKQEE